MDEVLAELQVRTEGGRGREREREAVRDAVGVFFMHRAYCLSSLLSPSLNLPL